MKSGHPLYFSLVSAYGNDSHKRTALLTDTFFFNSLGCPLTRELTVSCSRFSVFHLSKLLLSVSALNLLWHLNNDFLTILLSGSLPQKTIEHVKFLA